MDVQCKLGVVSQEQLKIEVKLCCWVLIGSHICRVDWYNNGWPWVTLNGRFTPKSTSYASHAISAVA